MKQIRCESSKNKAIRYVNVNVSSAKTTPASTANNFSWLFAINASLNIIFNTKKSFYFKKCQILCFLAKKFFVNLFKLDFSSIFIQAPYRPIIVQNFIKFLLASQKI
jgi:hypothetical protein